LHLGFMLQAEVQGRLAGRRVSDQSQLKQLRLQNQLVHRVSRVGSCVSVTKA
jgi:hypothetical protein